MANTSSRTLRLLSLLQTRRYWPGPVLAERLGVSPRTLRRDVDRLRELGYPVEASRGVDGGYQLAAGATLPPLILDDEEAVALAVGMQAATQGAASGIQDAAVRALAKVVQVMPARLRRRVDAVRTATVPGSWGGAPGPAVDADVLAVLAQACRDAERVRFRYTAQDGAETSRHAEPLRLVSLGRRWYVVAYDLDRNDWRSFRLDRVTGPRGTGARFRPRELPAADAAAFVLAGITRIPASHAVEAVVEAPAERVRERMGRWFVTEELGADRCRVTMTTDDLLWPAMALGVLGEEFEVVSPPELRTVLAELSTRLARAADGEAGAISRASCGARPGRSPAAPR
ncbi:helix-turn-helix transcriptional regulator [Pseudonocardia lacus]|uniref:helix-turn-helix transcriptional regulator n=1 Tax=Pseudonocardia lacus TaxID=2835865 RepID=UPI001BDC5509|nr:YafY family protein [Pseudonocardia lacus]